MFSTVSRRNPIHSPINVYGISKYAGELLTRTLCDNTGIDAKLNPTTSDKYPTKAKRPKNSALSIEKIRSYGIEMRHWRDALRDYLMEKGYL